MRQHRRPQRRVRDPPLAQRPQQRLARHQLLAPRQAQRRPARQRLEEFLHRLVEAEGGELQHPAPRPEPEQAAEHEEEVDERAVLDDHALGPAGRARGVDDVGGVAGRGRGRGLPGGLRGEQRPLPGGVERQQAADPEVGELLGEALVREDERGPGVREHEAEAVLRVGGVEREVGGSRLEDAEDGRREVERALHADADDLLGADAERAEAVRDAVGPPVQLAVGEFAAAEGRGRGVGRGGGDLLEEFVGAGVGRVVRGRSVPPRQQFIINVASRFLHHHQLSYC